MEQIQCYKMNEVLEHKYYQIPQELFTNPLYQKNLSSDSKLLYGFLIDRLTLSQKNNWYDKDNNVYLIFTRNEVKEKLNLSDKTVTKAFLQLSKVGLVKEKKQGFGKPNLIFVGKIIHEIAESENLRFENYNSYDSKDVKSTSLDTKNLPVINTNDINTDNIKPYSINTNSNDELDKLKNQCKLYEFDIYKARRLLFA